MEAASSSSAHHSLEFNDASVTREEDDTKAEETLEAQSVLNQSNSNLMVKPSSEVEKAELRSYCSCQASTTMANGKKIVRRKKGASRDVSAPAAASSSSSVSSFPSQQRGLRLSSKCRIPRVSIGGNRRGETEIDALALPLGMSIAAVVAQVLDREHVTKEKIPLEHISAVCASAVRESLANAFGDRFDCFVKNFEKSFGSTLRTLHIINEASLNKVQGPLRESSTESCGSVVAPPKSPCKQGHSSYSQAVASTIEACLPSDTVEEIQENLGLDSINRELALHGQMHQQLAAASSSGLGSGYNHSMLSTFEKSVKEQARSNDLKTFEIGLIMKRLQLKESQLALHSNSNFLERFKLSMGISKASFKAEKFKTQLEDARHAEQLKKCIDYLVAGLLIMSASLLYGAYVYSYKRITDATGSCSSSPKEATSWWVPKQVASFNSWLDMMRCQVEVFSRMLFGVLMIVAIAYLLFQRSATSNQMMPVTFILLLLGVGCGIVGKLCIDTLGGNGYHWLLYWEALCLLHLLANMCTSALFSILYGPVLVAQGTKARAVLPYWLRRLVFYVIILLFLPLLGGLLPFASLGDWKEHFLLLITDNLFASAIETGS
ncbi:protein CPR-5-like [Macadamia integrifolia]|uniref:protein CPR-5-like n=1 Tax=Macadamia integrifolia TaxID=60698 RepID=UPI001C4FE5F9|nr:protein CPR-5-like [Macadamia integrifolia]